MAFTALYEGDERGAWSVPRSERATCPECGDEMHVVSESSDGRARHFSHNPDHNGGGGGGGGCSGGESDDHKKWKNFAAERLDEIFGDRAAGRATVEEPLAAPWSDKENRAADACVFFENWDRQFGRGLAIEVQHKHKDKDKHAVEMDYNRQDVAVLWLSGDDFHDNGLRMAEVDIRHRTREQTSINEQLNNFAVYRSGLMGCRPAQLRIETVWGCVNKSNRDISIPARIVKHWVLPTPTEYWRNEGWEAAFRYSGRYPERQHRLNGLIQSRPTTLQPQPKLPRPVADKIAYRSNVWQRSEPREPTSTRLVFSATLPFAVVDEWLSDNQKPESIRVEPPPTGYDDVQCWSCGNYQYAPSAGLYCPNCGEAYDWDWNINTGRISAESLPVEEI